MVQNILGENNKSFADALQGLATTYTKSGEYRKSLKTLEIANEISVKLYGENHLNQAELSGLISNNYKSISEYEKSLEYVEKYKNILIL